MCLNYENQNICETRADDFHANDGDFVDVILLYFPRLLYLDCLKFLRLQSLLYRKHICQSYEDQLWGDR
jgi:hypothetical protein